MPQQAQVSLEEADFEGGVIPFPSVQARIQPPVEGWSDLLMVTGDIIPVQGNPEFLAAELDEFGFIKVVGWDWKTGKVFDNLHVNPAHVVGILTRDTHSSVN